MDNYVFGANILENLTTGMYQDSRVIYREYREEDKPPIEDQQDDCVVCLRCGQPLVLIPGRKRRLFCSDACRVAYWRTQAKPKEQPRRCLNCGRLLLGNNSRRKYCDHACYIEHRFGEGGEKHAGERQHA